MHMTLYWGKGVTLLFDSWRTDSWPSYAFALLLCFLFAALYQLLESLRLRFRSSLEDTSSLMVDTPLITRKLGRRNRRVASACLFGISSAMGYLIMLAIMSYNGGVLVAVVVGLMLGYYLFRSEEYEGDDESVTAGDSITCACS